MQCGGWWGSFGRRSEELTMRHCSSPKLWVEGKYPNLWCDINARSVIGSRQSSTWKSKSNSTKSGTSPVWSFDCAKSRWPFRIYPWIHASHSICRANALSLPWVSCSDFSHCKHKALSGVVGSRYALNPNRGLVDLADVRYLNNKSLGISWTTLQKPRFLSFIRPPKLIPLMVTKGVPHLSLECFQIQGSDEISNTGLKIFQMVRSDQEGLKAFGNASFQELCKSCGKPRNFWMKMSENI